MSEVTIVAVALAGRGAAVEKAIAGGIDGRRGEKKGGRRPGKAPTFQRRVVGNYVKRRERGDAVECERGRRERRSSVGRSARRRRCGGGLPPVGGWKKPMLVKARAWLTHLLRVEPVAGVDADRLCARSAREGSGGVVGVSNGQARAAQRAAGGHRAQLESWVHKTRVLVVSDTNFLSCQTQNWWSTKLDGPNSRTRHFVISWL